MHAIIKRIQKKLKRCGRIFCIPFNRHFPPAKQDRNLLDLFTEPEAASAIFNWVLEGYAMYKAEGLRDNIPVAISAATQDYNDNSDTFGQFLRECIAECQNDWTGTSDIYHAYEDWTKENGHHTMSSKNMVMELRRRGYHDKRRNVGNGFCDVVLIKELPENWRVG